MKHDATFSLLIILLLILANAFFVAAEFALVRIRRTRIDALIADGIPSAKLVKDALDHINQYISATQVGVTVLSLALGWLGEPFLADDIFHPLFTRLFGTTVTETTAHIAGAATAFFLITFVQIVLGELIPKNLSLQFPETVALYLIRPMRFFTTLFRPFVWLLTGSSNFLMRMAGLPPSQIRSLALSEEEILLMLMESKKAGVVSEDEQRMLQRVFKFHDKTVREIMKPRLDIAALDLRATEQEIKAAFDQGYSRMPVYEDNLSNIKGIVYVKDLIYTLRDPKLIKLIDLLREAIFVPETKAVSAVLRDFQSRKVHMAIVVDEFGDTAGIVTLEDVIEEIVGEIQDEYDYEPAEIVRSKDGSIVFEGKTDLDRFKEIFPNFEPPEGSFETVAGLVFALAGRVPRESDVLRYGDLSFRILKREGRRLRKIEVRRDAPKPVSSGSDGTTGTESKAASESQRGSMESAAAANIPSENAEQESASDHVANESTRVQ